MGKSEIAYLIAPELYIDFQKPIMFEMKLQELVTRAAIIGNAEVII